MQLLRPTRQLARSSTCTVRRHTPTPPRTPSQRRHVRTAVSSLAIDAWPIMTSTPSTTSESDSNQLPVTQQELPQPAPQSSTAKVPTATRVQLWQLQCVLALISVVGVVATVCKALVPGVLLLSSAFLGVGWALAALWRHYWVPQQQKAALAAGAAGGDITKGQDLIVPLAQSAALPAEARAWLACAQQGLWPALWRPLTEYKEELQEALSLHGPLAWAYDASDISIGSLAPTFSGVQAFVHPKTGALAAVEADVVLDTSTGCDSSMDVHVVARGPIGRYSFSLESARVSGRVRLMPAPNLPGQLLVCPLLGPPSRAEVVLSTGYPTLLPHNRTKLSQVDDISAMLQETLQGVLGSTEVVRLQFTPQLPARLQYAVDAAARAAGMAAADSSRRVVAALQRLTGTGAGTSGSSNSNTGSSARLSPAELSADASSGLSHAAVAPNDTNVIEHSSARIDTPDATAGSNSAISLSSGSVTPRKQQRNSTVSQSAALLLAAQKTAWRQQQQQGERKAASAADEEAAQRQLDTARSNISSAGASRGQQSKSNGSSWQVQCIVAEEVECWAVTGLTAKLSASAASTAGQSHHPAFGDVDAQPDASSAVAGVLLHIPGAQDLKFCTTRQPACSAATPAHVSMTDSGSSGTTVSSSYAHASCALPVPLRVYTPQAAVQDSPYARQASSDVTAGGDARQAVKKQAVKHEVAATAEVAAARR